MNEGKCHKEILNGRGDKDLCKTVSCGRHFKSFCFPVPENVRIICEEMSLSSF